MSDPSPHTDPIAKDRPPATLFEIAWHALVDILGSATAATLVRRAATRAAGRAPSLKNFTVARERLEYRCVLPPWKDSDSADLRVLCEELAVLLRELTGPIVIARLHAQPELRAARLFEMENEP